MRSAPTAALACIALFALAACESCRDDAIVAELATTLGTVQRDFAARAGRWQTATVGAAFAIGDALRTGPGSVAEVKLRPDGRLRVEPETLVRFAATAPERGGAGLELETGALELEALAAGYEVASPGGLTRVERGARTRVRADATGTTIAVEVGRVLVEHQGRTHELRAGDSFELQVGAPTIERLEQPKPKPVEAPPQPDAAVEAPAPPAATEPGFDVPPEHAELELPAGESATVHDPRPPTAVRVAFPGCAGGLALEIARPRGEHVTKVRGTGAAIASLPAGQFRYRVRCAQADGAFAARPAAEGRLVVVRDAATRKLPTTAPAVTVNADGRRYTVRYQNLPPTLTLRWPEAPKASAYELELSAPGRPMVRERAATPSITLRSGRIEEGTYAFRFDADGMRSPEGAINVVFDNTARIAYLSEPRDGGFRAGESVRVAGAALRGARVDVEGQSLSMQGHSRFATQLVLPFERRALAVRVQHAATGVHYFVRHAAQAAQ